MKVEAHDLLKIYFERKKLTNPSYSLRALARDLEVSPAYASAILSGKKSLPEARIKDFIKVLDLDDVAALQLRHAVVPEVRVEAKKEESASAIDPENFNCYTPLDKKKYEILDNWFNIAIMDLTTCTDFVSSAEWIAKKLKISKLETEIAIENLKFHNLLVEVDGRLQKVEKKLRFPTKMSQTVIRKFHKQMIKKAYEELDNKTEDDAFDKRLITGATFALNEEKMKILKEKIQNAIYEVSIMASEGPCQSVYQMNVQFFPLTK